MDRCVLSHSDRFRIFGITGKMWNHHRFISTNLLWLFLSQWAIKCYILLSLVCSLTLNVTGQNPVNKLHLFACEMLSAAVYAEIRKAVQFKLKHWKSISCLLKCIRLRHLFSCLVSWTLCTDSRWTNSWKITLKAVEKEKVIKVSVDA